MERKMAISLALCLALTMSGACKSGTGPPIDKPSGCQATLPAGWEGTWLMKSTISDCSEANEPVTLEEEVVLQTGEDFFQEFGPGIEFLNCNTDANGNSVSVEATFRLSGSCQGEVQISYTARKQGDSMSGEAKMLSSGSCPSCAEITFTAVKIR